MGHICNFLIVLGQLFPGRWGCHLISVVCAFSVSLALCTSIMSLVLYKHMSSNFYDVFVF